MRWCPTCGQPKEIHSKVGRSTRLPKVHAQPIRECPLETVDWAGDELDIPVKRANRSVVASRLAAYDEERSLRFA